MKSQEGFRISGFHADTGIVLALGRAPIQQRGDERASVENIINTNRPFRHHQHHLPRRFQGGWEPGAIPPS